LKEKIQKEKEPWRKGIMIHEFADTFGHLKIHKIKEAQSSYNGITFMTTYTTVGFRTGESTYAPGLGHGADGHDPDLIALRPALAKEYLTQLFRTLGGKDVGKLQGIFDEIDDIAKTGITDHPDKFLKEGSSSYALNVFKKLAIDEEFGYEELTNGRQYFHPEEKTFFMDGRAGWKLSKQQIETIFPKQQKTNARNFLESSSMVNRHHVFF
jgi:hypothetical protein